MMRKFHVRAASRLSSVCIVALCSTSALAQESQGEPALAKDERLGDIIVTARLRAERLQDVPVAATAFSAKDLDRYQTQSFDRLAAQTPSLVLGSTSSVGGAVINLRGVGSPSSGTTIDQAVSINVDGIQFSQANVLKLGLHDLDRIEILKGPQALFYGKNSPAGVISIASAGPSESLEAKLRGGYEFSNKRKFIEGTVSGPLTDTLGARLTAYYGDQKGWFRNDSYPIPSFPVPASLGGQGESTPAGLGPSSKTGPNADEIFVRGTLAYRASDDSFDASLKAAYSKYDRKGGFGVPGQNFACRLGAPQFVVALNSPGSRDCKLDRNYNEPVFSPGILALNPGFGSGSPFTKNEQLLISLTANFRPTDQLTVTSVTGYYKLKEKVALSNAPGNTAAINTASRVNIEQFSQELRALTTFDFPLNFMGGAYFQHVDNTMGNLVAQDAPYSRIFSGGVFTGPLLFTNNVEGQKTKAWSVYGQAILDITKELQITAGGRYSHERKSVFAQSLPYSFSAGTFFIPILPGERSFHDFSPEVTVTYKPVQNLSVYGAYREGFKSGGYDLNAVTVGFGRQATAPITNISYDPETVSGGEIGMKGSLFNRQLIFDVAAFRYKYKGLQTNAFDAITLGYRITNAGSAIVKGVELAAQFRPKQFTGLNLRTSFGYNDSRYGSFPNAPCYTGQTPAGGCAFRATRDASGALVVRQILPGETANAQDISGRPLVRASKWNGNIGGSYEYNMSNGMVFEVSADETYAGPYFSQSDLDPRALQKKAWRLSASARVRGKDDRWSLALIGTNLTNVLRVSQSNGYVATGSGTGTPAGLPADLIGTPTEPRTVTLEFTVKY